METKIYNSIAILLFSVLLLASCRSSDTDNNLIGKQTQVKINLTGTEFANADTPSPVASINHKGLSESRIIQRQSILVSPSSFITVELAPDASLNTIASTSKNLNTTAAISGDPIGAGMKFRVIAYSQNDGSYQAHQDYTIGQSGEALKLDGGRTYDIIVYSYGVNTLPIISANELVNIGNATVSYDDINRDFMYQKVSYTPDGNISNNILNITLRHKLAQINTTIHSVGLGDITNITNGLLTSHYSDGVFPLSSATLSGRNTLTSGAALNFLSSEFPGTTITAEPILMNADTNGTLAGGFSADISIAGINKTISLPNSFKITPGNKSNLTINLMKCGAYIGDNNDLANFKEFMCQNLGATEGINPFSPEAGNHGAKYQWGANTNETGRYISQTDDQSNSGNISGWSSSSKPNGSWSDTNKTANDPCPTGYRVPTYEQWKAVIDNNNVEMVGSGTDDVNNYTTAIYFKNPSNIRTLMLPLAGFRNEFEGILRHRGSFGNYRSSNVNGTTDQDSYHLGIYSDDDEKVNIANSPKNLGMSIRCIKE